MKTEIRRAGRPTRDKARQREEELLDKALNLFLENGFERTTIDAIAASAGMAKRTMYVRFPDKAALFKASIERAIAQWIVPVERLREAESADLLGSLLKIGLILVENIMSPAGLRLLRLSNAESARMPEIGIYAHKQGTDRTITYLADLFRRRLPQAAAEAFDLNEAAQGFLYLVVHGPASMSVWGVSLDRAAIGRHTSTCVRLFLQGLLPRDIANVPCVPLESARHQREVSALPQASLAPASRTTTEENRCLKILLADAMLEIAALRERPVAC
jgi:TetR/AcrR family transcriptional regulator, mexJK operon transcriptional repressor